MALQIPSHWQNGGSSSPGNRAKLAYVEGICLIIIVVDTIIEAPSDFTSISLEVCSCLPLRL